MIKSGEIQKIAGILKLRDTQIEKDYILGWVLKGISNNDFLINAMFEVLDQYDRMSIALKLAKGRRTKVKSGNKACGNAPMGYKWNVKAEIETDEANAKVIDLIFKKYLELGSISKVKKYF